MLKQTEDETIDNLNGFLKNMTMGITSYATNYSGLGITKEENHIENLDSWLDFKWNFLKYVVEQNQNDSNYRLYKTFFNNKDNKSKILAIIIPGTAKQLDIAFRMLVWCLKISKESKINVTEIYDKLNNNQTVELKADNDFIKFCKGMYRWSQPDLNMTEMFKGSLFSQAVSSFFNENQFEQVKYVFKNVQYIKCNDEEFKEVQKILLGLELDYDPELEKENIQLLKFKERNEIIEVHESKKKTDQTTNPCMAPAIIGIFLPIVPSIVFIINMANKDKLKQDIAVITILIIVGLIPIVSAIVFGILAYQCEKIINDNYNKPPGGGVDYNDNKESRNDKSEDNSKKKEEKDNQFEDQGSDNSSDLSFSDNDEQDEL
ncbi:MAG: hypothetical protein IJU86_04565 [Firmicutes bacterium]|nr:hypothetical protein [Bacillota bacterium]